MYLNLVSMNNSLGLAEGCQDIPIFFFLALIIVSSVQLLDRLGENIVIFYVTTNISRLKYQFSWMDCLHTSETS